MNVSTQTYQNFYFSGSIPIKKSAPGEKKCMNYYPFGLKHKGYNNVTSANGNSTAQKYDYNGKEFQDELGSIGMIMEHEIMMLLLGDDEY